MRISDAQQAKPEELLKASSIQTGLNWFGGFNRDLELILTDLDLGQENDATHWALHPGSPSGKSWERKPEQNPVQRLWD